MEHELARRRHRRDETVVAAAHERRTAAARRRDCRSTDKIISGGEVREDTRAAARGEEEQRVARETVGVEAPRWRCRRRRALERCAREVDYAAACVPIARGVAAAQRCGDRAGIDLKLNELRIDESAPGGAAQTRTAHLRIAARDEQIRRPLLAAAAAERGRGEGEGRAQRQRRDARCARVGFAEVEELDDGLGLKL